MTSMRSLIGDAMALGSSFCWAFFTVYGVKVTGATVHFVNEIPDGGEIILQKAVSIRKDDTPEKLQKRVMQQAEWKILPRAVEIVSKELMNQKK